MKTFQFKKMLMLICLIGFGFTLQAQEDDYIDFLNNALTAAKKGDQKGFTSNLTYFSVAIQKDKITPSTLSSKSLNLYTQALYQALLNKFTLSNELSKQAIEFLKYDINNRPENMFSLGYLYQYGLGVTLDYKEAFNWYSKASQKGVSSAYTNLGFLYQHGYGVRQNYEQSVYMYQTAADMGDDIAMSNLGYAYSNGLGVTKDYITALEWYIKAIETNENNSYAMASIGYMYQYGQGIELDYTKAKYWYEEAAKYNNATALTNLGYLYQHGYGTKQNFAEALYWYRKGADAGNGDAMTNLGYMYDVGEGVEKDISKAVLSEERY